MKQYYTARERISSKCSFIYVNYKYCFRLKFRILDKYHIIMSVNTVYLYCLVGQRYCN